jgi:hypothetical protein
LIEPGAFILLPQAKNISTFAIQIPGEVSDAKGTPLEVVERARLESVYTSKGYRGFE